MSSPSIQPAHRTISSRPSALSCREERYVHQDATHTNTTKMTTATLRDGRFMTPHDRTASFRASAEPEAKRLLNQRDLVNTEVPGRRAFRSEVEAYERLRIERCVWCAPTSGMKL